MMLASAQAAAAVAGSNPPVWMLLLLVVLGGGTVSVVINAWANRKKNSADTVKAIQEAAGGMLEQYKTDNARLREENEKHAEELEECVARAERRAEDIALRTERREVEFRRRIARLEAQMAEEVRFRQLHVAWDWLAIAKLQQAGIEMDAPPPLHPPFVEETPPRGAWTVSDSTEDDNPPAPTTEGIDR